jgi:Tfp pilus assembly protein PilX
MSASIAPCIQHLTRRRRQRGSALFITVMVITVLTAIGMFSMHAASLADRAAGFNRQGVQTMYVAEFAARAVTAEMVGKEQHYFQYVSLGTDDCRANAALEGVVPDGHRLPCYKLQTSELWRRIDSEFPGRVGTTAAQDVTGEMSRSELEGSFIVEMTDLARAGTPIAGEDVAQDQFKFMHMQVTATGQVRPGGGDNSVCTEAFAATAGLSNVRAQITFGPVF